MEAENHILKEISQVEEILSKSKSQKYSAPIDINDDNWFEIAKRQGEEFYNENKNIIEQITKKLIEFFPICNQRQRKEIIDVLNETENLKSNLSTNLHKKNSKEWFEEKILLFILADLGNDSRDALLELNELYNISLKSNIDLKSIVKDKIELASDLNKHGMGSTKSILYDFIS